MFCFTCYGHREIEVPLAGARARVTCPACLGMGAADGDPAPRARADMGRGNGAWAGHNDTVARDPATAHIAPRRAAHVHAAPRCIQ